MTRATDVIAHLLPRKAAPIVERQTGLPFGWGLWLRALPERLGRITKEKADAIVDALAVRAPHGRRAVPFLPGRARALRSLFYQGWGPPPREERWMRWAAGVSSSVLHLLFFLFLLWVALVKIPPPPEEAGDSSRVRLQMVGEGSPEDVGGATQAGETSTAQSASAAAASPPSVSPSPAASPSAEQAPPPSVVAPAVAMEVLPVPPRDVPVPEVADQPLRVTEVAEPTRAFVRPPPTPRQPDITQPAVRDVGVPTREIPAPDTAPVVRRDVPVRTVDVPAMATRDAAVREREMAVPAPQVRAAPVPSREVTPRAVTAQERGVRQADIREPSPRPAPMPAPQVSTGTSTAASPSTASSSVTTPPNASATTAAPRGTTAPAASTRGPLPAAKPGGWNTPARTDDWGNARDNVAGDSAADGRDKAGLYNADGSLRVPGNAGDAIADRGAPGGGNDQWTRERLEEAGTWLQRPPYDYEPTSFDKYWVPSESLLAEWVRRNVREMEIAIPGTNMKLKCSISVLQLGGGCGLGSLFPEPPKARPPPEIPVKRTPIPTDS
ncbi:hypothetical protein [Pseudoxanthomonas sp.]|uniref:hypothetical protein n=1 Tax=Pseudoxanthomonas sp. TaxID=1871049 RepID=UPI002FE34D20